MQKKGGIISKKEGERGKKKKILYKNLNVYKIRKAFVQFFFYVKDFGQDICLKAVYEYDQIDQILRKRQRI